MSIDSSDRGWNGYLFNDTPGGNSLAFIIIRRVALPCIVITVTALWIHMLYTTSSLIAGIAFAAFLTPIAIALGYFFATAVGLFLALAAAFCLGTLKLVLNAAEVWM